jgi:uncharacterized repeat protein (TIGR03837 family)
MMHRCDIFCKVIDNYGDAGIAWRLAHGLADTYGFDVRLFIDDVTPLAQLAPDYLRGNVSVRPFPLKGGEPGGGDGSKGDHPLCPASQDTSPFQGGGKVADLVIECLEAEVPDGYVQALAERTRTGVHPAPMWVRYEYLTAEDWATGIHLKPSLHPQHPEIKRYFFAPGFRDGTGGLLFNRETESKIETLPLHLGGGNPAGSSILVFSYGHPELKELYAYLTGQGVRVDLPPGAAADAAGLAPTVPFRPQDELDAALGVNYDYVFVRGEDSLTQAVAAGTPTIWQIYPQDDNAHHAKLDAFLDWYLDGAPPTAANATRALYRAWNFMDTPVIPALDTWITHLPDLTAQAQIKAAEVRARHSALQNLVDFYHTIG